MSEERSVVQNELLGSEEMRPCAVCDLPKPKSDLMLVPAETLGHIGGGNVDVCSDCYSGLQRGDVEPIGDPDF